MKYIPGHNLICQKLTGSLKTELKIGRIHMLLLNVYISANTFFDQGS